jgi:sorbitol-specific phosphotransferase system component IIC
MYNQKVELQAYYKLGYSDAVNETVKPFETFSAHIKSHEFYVAYLSGVCQANLDKYVLDI